MMQNLEKLREGIDKIDGKIIDLLIKRKNLVKNIAQLKKELKKPVFDNAREKQIIEKMKLEAREKNLDEDFIISIYDIILKNSREEQEKIVKE